MVDSYIPRYPRLRCIEEPGRIGKGGAVLKGFAAATGDCIGYVDADGATPPEAFDDLVAHTADAPVVIASRWVVDLYNRTLGRRQSRIRSAAS